MLVIFDTAGKKYFSTRIQFSNLFRRSFIITQDFDPGKKTSSIRFSLVELENNCDFNSVGAIADSGETRKRNMEEGGLENGAPAAKRPVAAGKS